ncbi:aminotransferase class V-fold PLP-dependent enzyme [Nonomuraea sp. bgisy101]|uniref:aminotransferase class V-fold PLP-dependent enzyme n=1 Tax=Nonomuraea sp. bgisy101 TaxID=3413784 RepID=UPI003D74183F
MLNRRTLLLGGAGATLAGCTVPTEDPKPPRLQENDWASVRAQFTLDPKDANFAAFVLAAHPTPVRAAIQRHREGLDGDTAGYLESDDRDAAVRAAAERYLGAEQGEVALTDSTTMGLSLIYSGFRLRQGQEVLTTEHDFYATHENLRMLAERTGARVTRVRLYDDPAKASADRIVAALKAGLTPRTRIVAVTWVHSGTGVRLPVRAIADMLAEANRGRDDKDRALLCVDGVHGFGALADSVTDLGCDFLASGAHKWLFGPRGTGIVYGRAWEHVAPIIPSFSDPGFRAWFGNSAPAGPGGLINTPGGYKAFEHRWAMAEAFAFQTGIGKDRVQERTIELATRLKQGLAANPHVRLITPMDPALSAGLVCCEIDGVTPFQATERLRAQRVLTSTTPYLQVYLRFGTSILISPEQVDQAVKAVAALT